MYAREIEGRTLEFGVSGKLYRNGLIMYDRQTDSEWSHVTGGAITGPYAGTRLAFLPALLTSWGQWRELYPDTLVLSKARSPYGLETYLSDPYGEYYLSGRPGLRDPAQRDDRLAAKDRVLGVVVEGRAKAYSFRDLKRAPAINDTLAGRPLLVVAERIHVPEVGLELDNVTAVAYSRVAEGQTLVFRRAAESREGEPRLRDQETGSLWRGLTGEALAGPLQGQRLQPLQSTNAFWFAWRDYFPQTEVFRPEGVVSQD